MKNFYPFISLYFLYPKQHSNSEKYLDRKRTWLPNFNYEKPFVKHFLFSLLMQIISHRVGAYLNSIYVQLKMMYFPALSIVLFTLFSKTHCVFPKSVFLKSLEDVIKFNSHCHIILLLQQPFKYQPLIHSPSTILTFTNRMEERDSRRKKKDNSIHVTRIKGINCIYAIVVQVKPETPGFQNRTTEQLFYYGGLNLASFHGSWSNVSRISYTFFTVQYKKRFDIFYINRMTHVVWFTTAKLPFLHETEGELIKYFGRLKKVGIVLLEKSHFKDNRNHGGGSETKCIKNYLCSHCAQSPPHLQPHVNFSLNNLSRFEEFLKMENDKQFVIIEFKQWTTLLKKTIRSKYIHGIDPPMKSVKDSDPIYRISNLVRKYVDYYMVLSIARANNLSVQFCDQETIGNCRFRFNRPNIFASEITTKLKYGGDYATNHAFLFMEDATHSFITCYNKPVISIRFYVSPFQNSLWVCFILSIVLVWSFWNWVYKYNCSERNKSTYSLFLFLVSTLTDDSCGLPAWFDKNLSFRLSFSAWFLATLVLVNGYIGALISGLTSGFEKESVHSFANLSKQHYSYDEITSRFLWCKMGHKGNYFWRNGCTQNYSANDMESYCFRPRDFDERKDFRIFSSPLQSVDKWYTKKNMY